MIMQIDPPRANHNGCRLAFGPDGYLYIGSGDAAWKGDPWAAGQNLCTLLGKLLCIDVEKASGSQIRCGWVVAHEPMYMISCSIMNFWWLITDFTRSPIDTTPTTRPPFTTGRWRIRFSVITARHSSAVSSSEA